MSDTYAGKARSDKVEEMHFDLQGWKSNLHFAEDEIIFIDQLLHSDAFQINTPNLFERLQDYIERLKKSKKSKSQLLKSIRKNESELGGMMESTNISENLQYYQKHDALKTEVETYFTNFKELKSEIFNYAGGTMKKRKTTPTG